MVKVEVEIHRTGGSDLFGRLGKPLDFRVTINAVLEIIHGMVCQY